MSGQRIAVQLRGILSGEPGRHVEPFKARVCVDGQRSQIGRRMLFQFLQQPGHGRMVSDAAAGLYQQSILPFGLVQTLEDGIFWQDLKIADDLPFIRHVQLQARRIVSVLLKHE
ncbi:hypothetical protein K788_00028520 [Paraburkholderia caribensis MBA4]|uniref:Uncharacterized protein n=1 Tax=Paraburkholderia caribensis MBA4 TaxID=1323664 RepID=A0A0P0RBN4_9BURK|nr:hypothetical protein K788_00028520 [Paraburkholderia caribensis MBA4]